MARNAGWLVDHDVSVGFEQDLESQARVRSSMEVHGARQALQGDSVAGHQGIALLDPAAVDPNLAVSNENLGSGTTELRNATGEKHIEPLPGLLSSDFELDRRHLAPFPHYRLLFHAVCTRKPRVYTPKSSAQA
jgi:hypothetical protein